MCSIRIRKLVFFQSKNSQGGIYVLPRYWYFKEVLHSLNPYQTRKYHQLLSKKAKTDKVDSLVIAGLLRSKEALASYVPEDEVQVLRELVRLRHHLQKDKKNYLRKAYTLLNLVFPEYTNLIKSPFRKVSSMILLKYPTAVDMARAKKTELVKMARRIQGNNYSFELAEKLIEAARESIYSP